MFITLETDYAIRIVSCLADADKKLGAKEISEKACVTHRFVLKITGKLCAAGIVMSYKGKSGGYALAKEPSQISLCDILDAIEGQYSISRCLAPGGECTRGMSGRCCFQCAFSEINQSVRKMLSEYTIESLHARRK
ncbi:MAG: Rrf2 family transcriptional regulator [Oscillospiraceae bacterium]|nr:Rrf2 family transcriptional regulator [Oscillospiraceae bacterium]